MWKLGTRLPFSADTEPRCSPAFPSFVHSCEQRCPHVLTPCALNTETAEHWSEDNRHQSTLTILVMNSKFLVSMTRSVSARTWTQWCYVHVALGSDRFFSLVPHRLKPHENASRVSVGLAFTRQHHPTHMNVGIASNCALWLSLAGSFWLQQTFPLWKHPITWGIKGRTGSTFLNSEQTPLWGVSMFWIRIFYTRKTCVVRSRQEMLQPHEQSNNTKTDRNILCEAVRMNCPLSRKTIHSFRGGCAVRYVQIWTNCERTLFFCSTTSTLVPSLHAVLTRFLETLNRGYRNVVNVNIALKKKRADANACGNQTLCGFLQVKSCSETCLVVDSKRKASCIETKVWLDADVSSPCHRDLLQFLIAKSRLFTSHFHATERKANLAVGSWAYKLVYFSRAKEKQQIHAIPVKAIQTRGYTIRWLQ